MKNDTEIFKKIMTQFVMKEDPLLEMLKWTMEQMMQIEIADKLNAAKGKHSEKRRGYLSGYRPRRFDTRLGTIYLMIPKVRKGGYIPFFITERKRSEQALISMVQEAYINGVSTRKIERLAKELGIENISASQVSQINKGLDEQVEMFRTRSLERTYPFVWVDALYEKIRNREGRVVSTAMMIAYGVTLEGKREILSVEPFVNESTATWKAFFDKLKMRGVEKIALLISDAHAGIQVGFKECFVGASWQRCKVHFMRNIQAYVSSKAKESFGAKLKQIWLQRTKEEAQATAAQVIAEFKARFPEAIEVLEMGLEDSLQFYHFPQIDKRKASSTNTLERINREIRRRSRVVSIFPSKAAYLRLITMHLIEYTEDWEVERSYIKPDKLQQAMAWYEVQCNAA